MKFEDCYAGYVVRDKDSSLSGGWVGPCDEMYRVGLRSMAVRFTKAGALAYIEKNKGNFVIEDAT